MKLGLRSNFSPEEHPVPFTVYTVGMEQQGVLSRLEGFSAHQLLITVSGRGRAHLLGQNKWDILEENTVLYVPAGFPNEYMPVVEETGCSPSSPSMARRPPWLRGDSVTPPTSYLFVPRIVC